jgi:hypothetical protein
MAKHTRMFRDVKLTQVLAPAVYTSDQNSTAVDMQGFGDLTFLASVGNSGDTLSGSVYAELELEHSDDNSAWTDCLDAEIVNPVTGTNKGTFAVINAPTEDTLAVATAYKGSKRYVRCVYNVTGTHTVGTAVAITAIQGLRSSSV